MMQLAYAATDELRAVVDGFGRTEDLKFSPDGSRLALAGLGRDRIHILQVELDPDEDPPGIALSGHLEIVSTSLHYPHGLLWLDDQTLIVANRAGQITLFEVPREWPSSAVLDLQPVRTIGPELGGLVSTPGSMSAAHLGLGLVELLVCNNYVHTVSRHLLDQRNGYALVASEALLCEGLDVPDGIMHCPSGRWLAVSNHTPQNVLIFRNEGGLNHKSPPHGVLRGVTYPHGLKFLAGGASLLVADAGAPFVHMFSADDDWSGERHPVMSIRVLDDTTFKEGQHSPMEGGPKGLEVTRDGRVMVTTCEKQPLAFFDLKSVLPQSAPIPAREEADEAERGREALIGYLAAAQTKMAEALEVVGDTGRRKLEKRERELLESHSWRITAPLRWIGGMLRRPGGNRG